MEDIGVKLYGVKLDGILWVRQIIDGIFLDGMKMGVFASKKSSRTTLKMEMHPPLVSIIHIITTSDQVLKGSFFAPFRVVKC